MVLVATVCCAPSASADTASADTASVDTASADTASATAPSPANRRCCTWPTRWSCECCHPVEESLAESTRWPMVQWEHISCQQ
jgi:hypothetical protein